MKLLNPVAYYHVNTSNKGDWAIKKSITEAILRHIEVPFSYFSVKNDELTEERIINQINTDCSALIIAGSGLYTNYPKSSGWYFPCKTELFKKIKVPIILIGLGCNQNLKGNILTKGLNKNTEKSIKLINDLAAVSTVRDARTYELLKNLNITKHELQLDPGNFLKVKEKQTKRKRVAIQLAQHAPILGRYDGGKEGQLNREKNINNFSNISNYLIGNGYSIVFIAHDALEQSIAMDIKKSSPKIEVLNTDNLDEMLSEYSSCRFSIGMKMHSNIMSFASGTPFLSLYYDVKTTEYLKMINYKSFGESVFINYYTPIFDKVKYMMKHWKLHTNNFRMIKKEKSNSFNNTIKKVCKIIKDNS